MFMNFNLVLVMFHFFSFFFFYFFIRSRVLFCSLIHLLYITSSFFMFTPSFTLLSCSFILHFLKTTRNSLDYRYIVTRQLSECHSHTQPFDHIWLFMHSGLESIDLWGWYRGLRRITRRDYGFYIDLWWLLTRGERIAEVERPSCGGGVRERGIVSKRG